MSVVEQVVTQAFFMSKKAARYLAENKLVGQAVEHAANGQAERLEALLKPVLDHTSGDSVDLHFSLRDGFKKKDVLTFKETDGRFKKHWAKVNQRWQDWVIQFYSKYWPARLKPADAMEIQAVVARTKKTTSKAGDVLEQAVTLSSDGVRTEPVQQASTAVVVEPPSALVTPQGEVETTLKAGDGLEQAVVKSPEVTTWKPEVVHDWLFGKEKRLVQATVGQTPMQGGNAKVYRLGEIFGDGKRYVLRVPHIDTLENLVLNPTKLKALPNLFKGLDNVGHPIFRIGEAEILPEVTGDLPSLAFWAQKQDANQALAKYLGGSITNYWHYSELDEGLKVLQEKTEPEIQAALEKYVAYQKAYTAYAKHLSEMPQENFDKIVQALQIARNNRLGFDFRGKNTFIDYAKGQVNFIDLQIANIQNSFGSIEDLVKYGLFKYDNFTGWLGRTVRDPALKAELGEHMNTFLTKLNNSCQKYGEPFAKHDSYFNEDTMEFERNYSPYIRHMLEASGYNPNQFVAA